MTVAIVGGESLDDLESLAVSFFGRIENRNAAAPKFQECSLDYQPFSPDELKTLVRPAG